MSDDKKVNEQEKVFRSVDEILADIYKLNEELTQTSNRTNDQSLIVFGIYGKLKTVKPINDNTKVDTELIILGTSGNVVSLVAKGLAQLNVGDDLGGMLRQLCNQVVMEKVSQFSPRSLILNTN